METRTITQVKIYALYLNPMPANYEKVNLVAIGYNLESLKAWYEEQKTDQYKEENWVKTFKKGSPLEWCNPIEYSQYGGISEQWATQDEIDQYISNCMNSFGFTAIPEIIN